jgi:hypothetical protein
MIGYFIKSFSFTQGIDRIQANPNPLLIRILYDPNKIPGRKPVMVFQSQTDIRIFQMRN